MSDEANLMDDLAEAWDNFEETDDGESGSEENAVHEPDNEPGGASGYAAGDGGDEQRPDDQDGIHDSNQPSDAVNQVAEEGNKPPVGLSPEAREVWSDVPDAVKSEIAKREKDYANGIKQYAESAKRAQAMDRTLQPYQQLFAMNGGAANFMPGLMQTASVLQMGAPAQKAEMVANLIKQFGVDIRTLDNLLVGQAPPKEVQQQSEVQQAVNQAVAPYQQHMQQIQAAQQHQQQAAQQEISNEVQTFASDPSHEFYHDVKAEMADILDLASNRGYQMTMQEAYDKACQLNPQISKILMTRGQAPTDGQRRAAGSVHGTLGGPGGQSAPDSMRAAIEDAWAGGGRV